MSTPETNSIIELLGVAVKQAELKHDENSEINFRRAFEKVRLLETERDDYQRKAFDIADERDELRAELLTLGKACDKIRIENQLLRSEVERLKADRARLDWLGRNNYGKGGNMEKVATPYVFTNHPSPYIRDAIDAAMKGAE
jgi:uncharacterized coiled-coil DUF342 family protein